MRCDRTAKFIFIQEPNGYSFGCIKIKFTSTFLLKEKENLPVRSFKKKKEICQYVPFKRKNKFATFLTANEKKNFTSDMTKVTSQWRLKNYSDQM